MMQKKGFTLVELMGVLIIIGVLSLILIPVISGIIKEQKQKQYEQQIINIELAAKNLGSDNLSILPEKDGEYMYLTLGQLKSMGYMEGSIINPNSKEEISDCARIKVTRTGSIYKYEYDKTTESETNCSSGNNSITISSPINRYIKNGDTASYIITINDSNTDQVLNKYTIDKTKVTLTGDTDATYSIIEGNEMYKVVIRGGEQEGEVGLKLESNAIVKNDTEDLIGESGITSGEKVIIDNTEPIITFGTNGSTSWAKTASSVISVSDNLSGGNTSSYKYVYGIYSATPNTAFTSGNTYSQTTGSGYYYLIASACDNSGNCTTTKSNRFMLDNEAPSCGSWLGQSTTWTNSNRTITMTGTDSKSGIKSGNAFSKTYSSGVTTTESLSHVVEDNLGNTRTCTATVNVYVDKSTPTISSATASSCSSNTRTITVNASESGSGIAGYAITTSTTQPTSFTASTSSSWTSSRYSAGTYYAWVKDSAGNVSSYKSVTLGTCDTTGPVITFGTNGSSGGWVAQASTTLTVTDSSGVSSVKYGWSTSSTSTTASTTTSSSTTLSSKCSRTSDGDCYLYVYACDTLGNCSSKRTSAFKLDVTAPSITNVTHTSCLKGLKRTFKIQDTSSGVVQYGHIHCDKDLGSTECYGFISGSRLTTVTATTSAISHSGEWTTCNTSGSNQPEANVGYSFWVKAIDAVGNIGKADTSGTSGDIKPYTGSACSNCS